LLRTVTTALRTAIVGLGSWGRTLVTAVQGKTGDLRYTHAVTRTPTNAEAFCREHDIQLVGSYDELLADPAIDAVVLATPNSQHALQVQQAAAAGKHVFVEKPLALDSAGARVAADAAQRAGVVLAAGLNRRFHPSMRALHRKAADGGLGIVSSMIGELTATTGFYRAADSWRTSEIEEPAGAMASIGVHLVDAMVWIAGRVRDVYCVAERRAGPHGKDTTTLVLRFESGATGLVFCSVVAARNFRMAVYGSEGYAEVLTPTMDTFRYQPAVAGRASHLAPTPAPETMETPGFNTVAAELIAFANCARTGTPYPVPVDHVLHGIAVMEAAIESTATGQPVPVSHQEK
jgi:predicted dehydrogenase